MTARCVLVTGHEFGRRALEGLLASGAYLEGQVACDMLVELSRDHSAETVGFSSSAALAQQHGIPVETTSDGSLRSLEPVLHALAPHYLLVIGWSRLVAPSILDLPAVLHGKSARNSPSAGCIGMHPTRLPEGRGQAPIPWTIIRGLRSTALSVFNLEDGADTGGILSQYGMEIRERETAASLFARFAALHFHAGLELGDRLAARDAAGQPQDDTSATVWPKRRPSDGLLPLTLTTAELDRMVRALTGPYPRAFVRIGHEEIRVDQVRLIHRQSGTAPGTITRRDGNELIVVWGGGELVALRVDPRDVDRASDLVATGIPLSEG